MIRLIVVTSASVGLILFVAFVISRLLRTRTRGFSVRMQVFLALAVIVGSFAFGLGLMVIDRIEARAVRLATQAAEDEAEAIAGLVQGEMERSGAPVEEMARRLRLERATGADLRLALLDREGRVLFPKGEPKEPNSAGLVFVDYPLILNGEKVGSVRVVKPTIVMLRLLEDFAPTVLVISLVLGATAAIAAAFIGRAIAAPIEALSNFSERVSAGERTQPPLAGASREVTRLIHSIDFMRRQLEGRPFVETFAADLSHELKNPVAAIRASAEVLEESALEEPEQARRFVRRIRQATARIERLLEELLGLARIESRGPQSFHPLDLADLARRAIEASGRAEKIEFTHEGDTRVRGDETWLSRAISNLVANALVHGTSDGRVVVSLHGDSQGVSVRVENDGEVSTHVRDQLFRRFVSTRIDKGGTGLGLAIVRAVVEAHGGRVALEEAGPPRVVFSATLPPARSRTGQLLGREAEQARSAV